MDVLKIDVDVVLINATVYGPRGRVVTGLGPQSFHVWEDKVEQKIEYLSQEEVPLSIGIIFDASGSMQGKASKARDAATTFLESGNREDEYFLVEFSDRPRLAERFTPDVSRLQNRLLFLPTRGRTALFDAVYLGLEKLKESPNVRKALLLISDGEDNHSRYTFSEIKEFAKERDVQIFAIGILNVPGSRTGRTILEDLAAITGGKAFFPTNLNELGAICTQITTEMKSQYIIAYRSTNGAKDGRWRKVHVRVTNKNGAPPLSVRTRPGYYSQGQ